MAKEKRAAIYRRVSTDKQTTDNQLRELEAVAKQSGWKVTDVYKDEGISGAKSKEDRPEFKRLYEDATRRQFDVVMAWSVDRLGRSLKDLVNFLEDLSSWKIDLYLYKQGIDTSTTMGKAFFQMAGVFAEFERKIIKDRVMAGLERAKAQGKTLGRPTLPETTLEAIREDRAEGMSIRKVAAKHNVSVGAVHKATSEQPVTTKEN